MPPKKTSAPQQVASSSTPTPEKGMQPESLLVIRTQYVKDLSFENPNPMLFFDPKKQAEQPEIGVDIQAHAQNINARNFEITLDLKVNAKCQEDVMFIVELIYAGIVTIDDKVNEAQFGPLLMIDSPNLLFPFARHIIAEAIRDGGYPPLMLAPVDFKALYHQQNA